MLLVLYQCITSSMNDTCQNPGLAQFVNHNDNTTHKTSVSQSNLSFTCTMINPEMYAIMGLHILLFRPCCVSHPAVYLTLLCTSPCSVPHPAVYLTLLCTTPCCVPHPALYHTLLCTSPCCVPHPALYHTLLCTTPCSVPHPAVYHTVLCMGEERLSSLYLMHIHYDVHINSQIVVQKFIQKQSPHLFLSLYHKESNSK